MNRRIIRKDGLHLRIGTESSGEQVFKALISHPMESGRRRDPRTGRFVPADYIETVHIAVDGETWFEMGMSENVSRNPLIAFTFATHVISGQVLRVSWVDNQQHEIFYDFVVQFDHRATFYFKSRQKEREIIQLLPTPGPACPNPRATR